MKTILIIDSDAKSRNSIEDLLKLGVRLRDLNGSYIFTGLSALNELPNISSEGLKNIALVITDQEEVVKAAKKYSEKLPVLFYYREDDTGKKGERADRDGVLSYIKKDVYFNDIHLVDRAIGIVTKPNPQLSH